MYALNCLKNTGSRNVHAVCVLLLLLSSPLVATADLVFHLPCEDAVNPMDVSVDPTPIVVHGQLNVVDAKIGSGLEFNGIDGDRLEVVDADKLDGMSAITIALWFLPRNPADYGLLTKRNNTNNEESYSIFSWMNPTQNIYFRINGNQGGEFISSTIPEHNMWYHIACVFDGQEAGDNMRLYLNGVLDASQNNPATTVNSGTPPVTIGALIPAKWPLDGVIDDVMIFNHALTQDDIQQVMAGTSPGLASNASPADEASDVLRDVILSWEPGEFAPAGNGHIVYFSESFNDVNDGIGGVTQSAASYTPAQRLEFGTTYYWRIDEVNAAPDNTIFKGEVWSFEVEPLSIPIENITATASAANPGMEASKTIDGSGLNEMDQHSILSADMWQATGVADTWIQYDFDKAYKLYEMLVWNSNTNIEPFLGFGAKEITIETSTDGTTWTALAGVHQLAQGTGLADYTANTSVDFGGAVAKYVKLTMVSAHGLTGQIGLSEVRFLAIPTLAREPQPTSGAAVNSADIMLSWRAGREAVEHKVLLGTDAGNLSLLGTVTDNQIDSGALAYATTYYWSVTEVNQAETPTEHAGEVWSFTTPDYGVVDDFETYSGKEGEEIFLTWFDGYGGDDSLGGSTTGHIDGPFVETTTVKSGTGGSQSMPVFYDNDGNFINIDGKTSSLTFSEVVRDFKSPQDWILGSPTTLVVSFHGTPGNTGQLYVKINGVKVVYTDQADAIKRPYWTQWNINLSSLGIDLKSVTQLSLGVEGGSGLVYIDDIFLYRTAPLPPQEQIWLQAEEADTITAPMTVYIDDPAAMGGRFIGTTDDVGNSSGNPPSPDGTATYTFTVKGGVYKINGRVIIPAGDSFWVRIVGATTQTSNHSSGWVRWSDPPNGTDWHWNEVFSAEDGNEVVEFTLAAGTHTLEIGYREDGAMLDAVVIESID